MKNQLDEQFRNPPLCRRHHQKQMKSQWLKDKEAQQLKWNLGALFCLGLAVIVIYIAWQTNLLNNI